MNRYFSLQKTYVNVRLEERGEVDFGPGRGLSQELSLARELNIDVGPEIAEMSMGSQLSW